MRRLVCARLRLWASVLEWLVLGRFPPKAVRRVDLSAVIERLKECPDDGNPAVVAMVVQHYTEPEASLPKARTVANDHFDVSSIERRLLSRKHIRNYLSAIADWYAARGDNRLCQRLTAAEGYENWSIGKLLIRFFIVGM